MHRRKFRYILGQFVNNLTGFTTFLESESERRAYESLQSQRRDIKKQYRLGAYRLDFFLPDLCICIEIDGQDHRTRRDQDRNRDAYLLRRGIRTLRIPADQLYGKNAREKFLKVLNRFI